MTNEEKASELAHDFFETSVWHNDVKAALIKMAEWKDNQAAAAYCKCCDTRECEDYESDTCDWLEKFKKVLKEIKL